MEEQLSVVQDVYALVVNFAVTYSFQLLGAVVVLIAGFIVGGWVSRLLLGVMERKQVDITLREFLASTMRLIVVGLFLIIALSQMGISITPLIAALGGLAVGASLAIQGPLSNYGAGLVIILTRMYKVGDSISLLGYAGIVREISLSTTILESEDSEQVVIPNKQIVGEIHKNSFEYRIVEGQVGISYEADPEAVTPLLSERLSAIDGVSQERAPVVGINRFSDAGLIMDYRIWVRSDRYFEILHEANLTVYKALNEAGVVIPFPHRDVRVVS